MTGEHGSAGTAGEGYRSDPEAHPWQPCGGVEDWGYALPPLCKRCKQTLSHPNHRALRAARGGGVVSLLETLAILLLLLIVAAPGLIVLWRRGK